VALRLVSIEKRSYGDGFPFDLGPIRELSRRSIESPVLLFVGDNGSGKSTLLEALAMATSRVVVGGTPLERDPTLDAVRPLARALRAGWSRQTTRGFFLRAEDFFGFARRNREIADEMQGFADRHADDARVRSYLLGQKRAIDDRYGELDALSHGESFLHLLHARLVPGGLYLLDEPEAALSPRGQLAFLSLLRSEVERGSQFVIATHSPFVLSYPEAAIWSFEPDGIRERSYDELDHVALTRDFLKAPGRFWRHL